MLFNVKQNRRQLSHGIRMEMRFCDNVPLPCRQTVESLSMVTLIRLLALTIVYLQVALSEVVLEKETVRERTRVRCTNCEVSAKSSKKFNALRHLASRRLGLVGTAHYAGSVP